MSDNYQNESGIPVKEIGELLDTVTTKLPTLVNGIVSSLYSEEAGANIGKSVGSLYKELLAAGIPQEEALQMAKDYMLSMKDLTSMMKD